MIGRLRSAWNGVLGRGDAAVTVPSMDGALRPNNALEAADSLLDIEAPDNLALDDGRLLFSSGHSLMSLDAPGVPRVLESFPSPVTAIAAGPGGLLAIGLEEGGVVFRGPGSAIDRLATLGGQPLLCPTALLFLDAETLIVCQGSSVHAPSAWSADLLERRATGSVWRVTLGGGQARCIAAGLAYPNGVLLSTDGRLVVSESWRHRLIALDPARQTPLRVVLGDLPGYPGRLIHQASGGAWLSVFAPRSQLVEFVLRERAYCKRMMREVAPAYWVAPALASGMSFHEPMQGGAVKQMGILKPWAPTRSYGLVVQLDAEFQPRRSVHSRADGRRHGVTSCIETPLGLVVACKGGNVLLTLPNTEVSRAAAA
jgi:hypothetical protein